MQGPGHFFDFFLPNFRVKRKGKNLAGRFFCFGKIAGAAIDVTEVEPLDAESPLLQADNLLITPHYAGSSAVSIPAAASLRRTSPRSSTMELHRWCVACRNTFMIRQYPVSPGVSIRARGGAPRDELRFLDGRGCER